MLKITVPFKRGEEVLPLVEAGADELYCGYLPDEWTKRYTGLEFERKGRGSNFTDLQELSEAVEAAHSKNIPVYLALNGLYVYEQYPLLLEIIDRLEKVDLDAYIVADIGLILTLRERGFRKEIHVSTGGTVFNSESVDFYRNLGASRIVLDRQVTLESIKELTEKEPYMDFEVFVLNTLCVYIDGFCTYMHTYGRDSAEEVSAEDAPSDGKTLIMTAYDPLAAGDACNLRYSVTAFDAAADKKIDLQNMAPRFFKHYRDGVECGACALYDIWRTKTKSVKIVGRQLHPKMRTTSTRFIRRCLDILKQDEDIERGEYIQKVQGLYREAFEYKGECRGNNCYHPDVLCKSRRKEMFEMPVSEMHEGACG